MPSYYFINASPYNAMSLTSFRDILYRHVVDRQASTRPHDLGVQIVLTRFLAVPGELAVILHNRRILLRGRQ